MTRPEWMMFFGWSVMASQGRFMSMFLQELGLTESEIGIVFAVPIFANTIVPMLWGTLADKVMHWRKVLSICAIGAAAIFNLLLVERFQTFGWVLVVRSAHVIVVSGLPPVMDGVALQMLERRVAGQGAQADSGAKRHLYGGVRLYGTVSWAIVHMTFGLVFTHFPYRTMVKAHWIASISFVAFLWLSRSPQLAVVQISEAATALGENGSGGSGGGGGDKYAAVATEEGTPTETGLEMVRCRSGDSIEEDPALVGEHDPTVCEAEAPPPPPPKPPLSALFCAMLSFYNIAFLVTIVVIAVGQSQVESLVFIFFREQMDASDILLGVSVVVTVSFEVPLMFFGSTLLKRLGPANMMIIGLAAYASRVYVYTLVDSSDSWLVLAVEPLHGVTFTCTQLASVYFVSELAPPGLESSAQGFLMAVRSIGFGFGVLLGAFVMGSASLGSQVLYRGSAAVVAVNAVLFALVARRCHHPGDKDGL